MSGMEPIRLFNNLFFSNITISELGLLSVLPKYNTYFVVIPQRPRLFEIDKKNTLRFFFLAPYIWRIIRKMGKI